MIRIIVVYFIEKLKRVSIFSFVGFLFRLINRFMIGIIIITTRIYHNTNSFDRDRLRKPNIIGSEIAENAMIVATLIDFFILYLTTNVCILSFSSASKSLIS